MPYQLPNMRPKKQQLLKVLLFAGWAPNQFLSSYIDNILVLQKNGYAFVLPNNNKVEFRHGRNIVCEFLQNNYQLYRDHYNLIITLKHKMVHHVNLLDPAKNRRAFSTSLKKRLNSALARLNKSIEQHGKFPSQTDFIKCVLLPNQIGHYYPTGHYLLHEGVKAHYWKLEKIPGGTWKDWRVIPCSPQERLNNIEEPDNAEELGNIEEPGNIEKSNEKT